jgi:CubicO group peptidase (beta-lactamase class C family)
MHLAPYLLLVGAVAAQQIRLTDEAPLLGPNYISNFPLANSTHIQDAINTFPNVVESLFTSDTLNRTDLIFTIDIFSADTNQSIYQYHHVGQGQEAALTSGELTDKTIGRLGSVTKLLTTYAILVKSGGMGIFRDAVTNYLPELRALNSTSDSTNRVAWEDITVGMLASHQAGTGGALDFLIASVNNTSPSTLDFLTFLRDGKVPTMAPGTRPSYSDAGYAVLGHVLERISGMSYQDAIRDILNTPLGLETLTATPPNGTDLDAIDRRPLAADSAWGVDVPILHGTGSLHANTADLRALGLSILNSELLSPVTTRSWMKPTGGTGSLVELVGTPWEIQRLLIPVSAESNRTRISDLYTKAGGNGDYTAIFALSPDHGLGFSILVAGSTATPARWPLRNAIGELFIPAAEAAAAENAAQNLAGTFLGTEDGHNITLTVDDNRPGIGVKSVFFEGAQILDELLQMPGGSGRLYPTGLSSLPESLSSLYRTCGTFQLPHRFVAMSNPLAPRAAADGGEGGLFDPSFAWANIGFTGTSDEFVFTLRDGRLTGVYVPLLETEYTRAN